MEQYAIKMPDIGEGIAEVELVAWRVQAGDTVAEDQIVADVMTDKATVEIPSPVAGTVIELRGQPGELLAVGAELVRLEVAQGTVRSAKTGGASAVSARAGAGPGVQASRDASEHAPPVRPAPPASTATHQTTSDARHPASRQSAAPAVRARARALGIKLQTIQGSGPDGRITHADLDAQLLSSALPHADTMPGNYAERHGEQAVPLIGLRRKIAQKMQEAKRRIAHFSYVEEVDVTALEALRARLNERYASSRGKLTLLPLLARALTLALRDFPQINARFDDEAGTITRYQPVHLGIATQTELGLMVPVVRHAEGLNPWACAREISRLAEACRAGRIVRDELSGSTITITSLGPLGGVASTPVINHPEVAIVGVNRIIERPVFHEGTVVGRQLMNLSSSFDHRVIDGMDAARFIQAVRTLLESPGLLFVE